jgi:hypothetical protein
MPETRGYPDRLMDEPRTKPPPEPSSDTSSGSVAHPDATDPAPGARPGGRVRLTSVSGTLAALLLGLCFFLDWIRVDPALGEAFQRGIDEAVAEREQPSPVDEDFQALAETLHTEGALTGMDLIHWVRTAGAFGRSIEDPRERAADASTQRIFVVARLLLSALLLTAFLLAAYFVFHGFRRVTAPVLILCILVGATAVVLAGGLHYAHTLVQDALGSGADGVASGPGPKGLLLGGAGLVLAGTFGVSARNFIRVYLGVCLTVGALYLLGLTYFKTGSLP